MPAKNKGNKKVKKHDSSMDVSPKEDMSSPIAQIISGVCKEGYSRKEVEEVFNMMWSEGNDFENVDLAIQQIKERLGVRKNEQKPENSKEEKKSDSSLSLEHKLNQVVSLPGIADILDGLIRWFNTSSEHDRQVLLNGTILHELFKRMLLQKGLTLPDGLLDTFFRTLFFLPSDVSVQVAKAFMTLHDYVSSLPLSVEESTRLFEDVLQGLANGMNTENRSVLHLANLISLIHESKVAVDAIEGEEPKSQFMRRDLRFKIAKLRFEAAKLASSQDLQTESAVSNHTVNLADRLSSPVDAMKAQKESENLSAELQALREKKHEATRPSVEKMIELEKSVTALQERRDALRKELEYVESQLISRQRQYEEAKCQVQEKEKQYHSQLESLETRQAAAATAANVAIACSAVSNDLEAAQKKSAEILQSVSDLRKIQDRTELWKATMEYLESEVTCVNFLEDRAVVNRSEADRISQEVQHGGHHDERILEVAKLRRSVANDLEAASSLRRFATEIEMMCSELIDNTLLEQNQEVLSAIYILFAKMRVPTTLRDELYSVLKPIVDAAVPQVTTKPVAHTVEKKPVEKKRIMTEQPKPVIASGKKWNVLKPVEAKSVTEIQKEIGKK